MHAILKASSRYGTAQLFSGHEFTKKEYRPVPKGFEDQARKHDLLDVVEGAKEREILEKQEKQKQPMRARLIGTYKDPSVRALSGREFLKDKWVEIPQGMETLARNDELLQIWESGQPEPAVLKAKADAKVKGAADGKSKKDEKDKKQGTLAKLTKGKKDEDAGEDQDDSTDDESDDDENDDEE